MPGRPKPAGAAPVGEAAKGLPQLAARGIGCDITFGLSVVHFLIGMALRVLFEAPHIRISYDYLNDWLYADWTGDQDLESVQAGATKMLELMTAERCHKVLNNNTHVTSMWSDAAEWGGTIWFPAMAAAGLHYFAWVYSPNVYSRLSTDLTLKHTVQPIVATFDDMATAQAWLQQM